MSLRFTKNQVALVLIFHLELIIEGIPKLYWAGEEGNYKVMVIELLGPSIEDLFTFSGKSFPFPILLQLAKQMIHRLQCIHSKGYLHRDLKPENFVIGIGKKEGILHLIDYGLAKKYIETTTGEHIKYKEKKKFVGAARYASLSAHNGSEQGRKDDLEALAYIFIYLLKGSLPWQGIQEKSMDDLEAAIHKKKLTISATELCQDLPSTFSYQHINS
eukprot:TRINITY_DN17119_c0_g1_i1.p1 TRINITY_DN17119_c0_g1~~TRINITY_DN17119_c0_g1_i1.p1  ORF type:complete len:216 (-),score=27.13 TRINITY_DN17119_c0_g1_i1:82-729(-)